MDLNISGFHRSADGRGNGCIFHLQIILVLRRFIGDSGILRRALNLLQLLLRYRSAFI